MKPYTLEWWVDKFAICSKLSYYYWVNGELDLHKQYKTMELWIEKRINNKYGEDEQER